MDKPSYKLVGAPCGQHGQYTFYKAIRFTGAHERIVAIGDFFFVKIWQDSELVSIGELQLLWTDRVSDQTLVSLRLYFLPENTPDGRTLHGEDEVLAINDKVVVRAEDLVSWAWSGEGWRWGLRAVWRGACAPPAEPRASEPLHQAKLDFTDVEQEKSAIADADRAGVVVFSYPRYCRYRALLARLEGVQGDWLRDSLVCALGGYAAPTTNTRILYCKDTFEYPELEGHEFVCNHLAPKLKGRPRGRRRRARSRDRDLSRSSRSSDSDGAPSLPRLPSSDPPTPRRLSLRNGAERRNVSEEEEGDARATSAARAKSETHTEFMAQLRAFHAPRELPCSVSLQSIYSGVVARGGYEAVCRRKLWRTLHPNQPSRVRRLYEKYLLPFENHERRNGCKLSEPTTVATIDVTDSPLREDPDPDPATPGSGATRGDPATPGKRLRTPSPRRDGDTGGVRDEPDVTCRPAEELNREFLESLPVETVKIAVKPVEQLLGPQAEQPLLASVFHDAPADAAGATDTYPAGVEAAKDSAAPSALTSLSSLGDKYAVNGHAPALTEQRARPAGRSSLRAVRVKPTRAPTQPTQPTQPPPTTTAASACEPPAITNFGIHRPPPRDDDDIVEVPYKPKTPEIIDLDEYPESPQAVKRKKLEILKERGLEVTPVPAWPLAPLPLLAPPLIQHPLQAQIFQMYNIIPPTYPNGTQPPKVIQATSIFGSSGPEKTVYGNPKDPFMPPPHVVHGTPVKPQRIQNPTTPPQDILDLTCKTSPKPAVEIVRVPSAPSPSKTHVQNLSKNYTLLDGKAVVGSNLEITLVSPKATQQNSKRTTQKRSSNGKFMSSKTTPPKESQKTPINVPNFSRDDVSPTSSTGSRDSTQNNLLNAFKGQNLAQLMEMQNNSAPMSQFIDPMYMSAVYNSLGNMDQRQLAMYRDFMANQFRGYSGLLNIGTPTTKN